MGDMVPRLRVAMLSAHTSPLEPLGGGDAIGTMFRLQVHDGRAQAIGVLAAGFGRAAIPFLNGFLWTQPASTTTVVLGGSRATALAERGGGCLHWSLAIPPVPSLRGLVVDWQGAFLDAAATGGISLTNGVELVIR